MASKKPKVVTHNSVSINGAYKGFEVDIGLHYQVSGGLGADTTLVGANTAKTGIFSFSGSVPEETESDFKKPTSVDGVLWAIIDTKGLLKNLLHVLRASGFCRDIIVFISEKTDTSYADYLTERNYDHYISGVDHVDLREVLEILADRYGTKTVMVDSGPGLVGAMLNAHLVDEVSLVVSPVMTGNEDLLFASVTEPLGLTLEKSTELGEGYLHLLYSVKKPA